MTVSNLPWGADTSATDRVHYGRVVSGARLLGEACYRRLITDRGTLLDDPTYGFSLRRFLGSEVTDARLAALPGLIRLELGKDDRIESGSLSVEMTVTRGDNAAVSVQLEISGLGVEGEAFDLVVLASEVTVELLGISES